MDNQLFKFSGGQLFINLVNGKSSSILVDVFIIIVVSEPKNVVNFMEDSHKVEGPVPLLYVSHRMHIEGYYPRCWPVVARINLAGHCTGNRPIFSVNVPEKYN